MNVLIVAATEFEIAPFLAEGDGLMVGANQVDALITGVGAAATTYKLTKWLNTWQNMRIYEAGEDAITPAVGAVLQNKYDFILQVGVGGSYDNNIALGDLVLVTSEQFGDLGAEDHEHFLGIFEMGLIAADVHPFGEGTLTMPFSPVHESISLARVKGLTVNSVSGNERTIKLRKEKFDCQVESMEGAAFHYVCLMENVPFAQVRAISNYVTPRDKSQWRMKEAINNLNNWLIEFVESLP